MASASLKKYTCFSCKNIPPDSVYICGKGHFYCAKCGDKAKQLCRCHEKLIPKKNPLQVAVEKMNSNCKYHGRGCSWNSKENSKHEEECKYRSSKCIGQVLNVFKCEWENINANMSTHLNDHGAAVASYQYSDKGDLPFDKNNLKSVIGQISAYCNNFIMYYKPDQKNKLINFVVLLCGTKASACKYVYEFEIISMKKTHLKIKFNQICISDSVNVEDVIRSGNCAAISFHVIENYVENCKISFRIRIMKVGQKPKEN